MIQQLKQMVIDQASNVDSIEDRFLEAMNMDFTEEICNERARLNDEVLRESARLSDLRQTLFYLRRAAGHKDIDVFNPERF